MKRIFVAVIAFLLVTLISNSAFAHSHLESSNPADGEVVTEALNEIILDFDGGIEEGSLIELATKEGQAVELQETEIVENTMTATVTEPLANGEYQVTWSVISADGHPLDGEFSFTIDAPTSEKVEEEGTESPDQSVEKPDSDSEGNQVEEKTSPMTIIFIVLVIVLVAGGFIYFIRRKK